MYDNFEPEAIYHVFNRAVGAEKLFRVEDNYTFFLDKYHLHLGSRLETIAYCLIPNHFHLLVKIHPNEDNASIIKSFSDFQNSYAKSYNKVFERHGSLFQRKFKHKKIEDDAYLTNIILYIHMNPIKHGLVTQFSQWKYSSFNTICSSSPTKISREIVLGYFGGLDGFKDFHQTNKDHYLPSKLDFE